MGRVDSPLISSTRLTVSGLKKSVLKKQKTSNLHNLVALTTSWKIVLGSGFGDNLVLLWDQTAEQFDC
jgi:hypothetical protein